MNLLFGFYVTFDDYDGGDDDDDDMMMMMMMMKENFFLKCLTKESAFSPISNLNHCWNFSPFRPFKRQPHKMVTYSSKSLNSRRIIWVCLTILWGWCLKC